MECGRDAVRRIDTHRFSWVAFAIGEAFRIVARHIPATSKPVVRDHETGRKQKISFRAMQE